MARIYENIVTVGILPPEYFTERPRNEWSHPPIDIRAWVERDVRDELPSVTSQKLLAIVNEQKYLPEQLADENILQTIAELVTDRLPNVNAVEVRYPTGGVLIYPNWP